MRGAALAVLAATGCRGLLGIDGAQEKPQPDAPAPDTAGCAWKPAGFDPCALGTPMPALHLDAAHGPYNLSTTTGMLTDANDATVVTSSLVIRQADQSEVSVLALESLAIDSGVLVTVTGARPLLVAAWSTIDNAGLVDGTSHMLAVDPSAHTLQTVLGPGGNVGCATQLAGQSGDGATTTGSGGGGGGAFQGGGGLGGSSGNGGNQRRGGAGGVATAAPPIVHGGCSGGTSGTAGTGATAPATANSHAIGGGGGGALWFAAKDSITITGTLGAGGGGGAGAPTNSSCGGGGGGSGGMIVLDAPTVHVQGTLAANGGGGGGGGDTANAGKDGSDARLDEAQALGGGASGSTCGQAGGAGSSRTVLGGGAGTTGCGGGGGAGGGAGFIMIQATTLDVAQAQSSPPLATH